MAPPDDLEHDLKGGDSQRGRWLIGAALAVWLAGTALSFYVHGVGPKSSSTNAPQAPVPSRIEENAERAAVPTGSARATSPGPWIRYPAPPDERRGDPDQMAAELRALGYLDAYEEAPSGAPGVQLYDPARSQPGANLLVSSHAPEASLIDMEGNELHRWELPFAAAFPEVEADPKDMRRLGWRRVFVYPNGDLLAIFEGLGLLKLDRNSRLLWARSGGYHHDLDVAPDGRIYALFREVKRLARIHPRKPVLEDSLHVMTAEGALQREISLYEALERSRWAQFLTRQGRSGDLLHTNAITWLDGAHAGRIPGFARGHLLLSSLTLDLIFAIDPDSAVAVWATAGPWLAQHEPRLLPSGRMLIFDNLGGATGSRVLEIDPVTSEIVWRYEDPVPEGFASTCCGTASRLSNGNTLIVDSTSGRAFEVTRDGEVVWDYRNPHRRGSNRELVAVLFDVIRLPPNFGRGWLGEGPIGNRSDGSPR